MLNIFGDMSYRTVSFVSAAAGAFSYFVLSHNNATAFFGVTAFVILALDSFRKDRKNDIFTIHSRIDSVEQDANMESDRRIDSVWREIDRINDRCEESCNKKR